MVSFWLVDVLELIDRLDALLAESRALPLSGQVRLGREEIFALLDEMRAVLPQEVKQARWIVKERQEMLGEVRRECERLVGEAREQARAARSEAEVTLLAERQAAKLLRQARRQADEIKLDL